MLYIGIAIGVALISSWGFCFWWGYFYREGKFKKSFPIIAKYLHFDSSRVNPDAEWLAKQMLGEN